MLIIRNLEIIHFLIEFQKLFHRYCTIFKSILFYLTVFRNVYDEIRVLKFIPINAMETNLHR